MYIHLFLLSLQRFWRDFSSDLSWSQHYSVITSRAYCQLGLICCCFSSYIAVKAKKLLYLSIVQSQLTYCSPDHASPRTSVLLNMFNIEQLSSFWMITPPKLLKETYRTSFTSFDVLLWASGHSILCKINSIFWSKFLCLSLYLIL